MASILLIDDEPAVLRAFLESLGRGRGWRVRAAETAAAGLALAREAPPDVVLLDLHLPDALGIDVLPAVKAIAPRAAVVFVTVSGAPGPVIEATRLGAFDYLYKPVHLDHLDRVLKGAFDAAKGEPHAADGLPPSEASGEGEAFIGRSAPMRDVYQAIGRAAPQDVTVLITGESGTGKELVARAIAKYSRRSGGPFVALNCAAIPEALLESELFGHEKGAFTGAERRRVGKFEQGTGGTIFLDEIGDMPPALQAKLLRVLQNGEYERVGGGETLRADARVIAATHRDLAGRTRQGEFRQDLFYRLSVLPIHLPPLRQRGDDIRLLVQSFLRRYNRELGTQLTSVDPEVYGLLQGHPWPGNVRELQSVLRQAMLRATSGCLRARHLPDGWNGDAPTPAPAESAPAATGDRELEQFVRDRLAAGSTTVWEDVKRRVDERLLALVLEQCGGSQVQAAQRLGVARQTLRSRLRELGLWPIGEKVKG